MTAGASPAPALVGQADMARSCGLSAGEIDELVDYGILVAEGERDGPPVFSGDWVQPLREACRLRTQFALDLFATGLLSVQLRRIGQLERQVRSLEAQLPHPPHSEREGPEGWREPH